MHGRQGLAEGFECKGAADGCTSDNVIYARSCYLREKNVEMHV